MKTWRSYKTELDPNDVQKTLLFKNAGVARFVYNWGLQEKKQALDSKTKLPNYMDLNRRLNAMKNTDFPWMYEVSKCSPQGALQNLDKAFESFFRKCKLKKQGKLKGKVGFPRFKSKKKGVGSFRLDGTIKVSGDRIKLPRLGEIRLKERNYIPTDAKVLNATVKERAGRWFVSVLIEMEAPNPLIKPEYIIGVDLGVKSLATCSNGDIFQNPRALQRHLKKLKRLGRLVCRKKKEGANRKKAVMKLARLHKRIGDIRSDTLHKITTNLAKTKSVVVIEDLNVSGMLKNHCLARAINDVGFGEFRRQMEYKGSWYGCEIVVADRFFPSSKVCSKCGSTKADLALSERLFACECGNLIDRDLNAAINLERYYTASSAGIHACGEPGSGSARKSRTKPDSMKQEMDRENGSPRFP